MVETDRSGFYKLVADVYAFYRVDCTPFALGVWWEACKPFDAAAVKDAFNRHAVNPDNGQFVPKPADIVKLIGGGTQDNALIAWSKVERAIRSVGPYQSVVFDDPITMQVLKDMGGWVQTCNSSEQELPFKAKEFQTRFRGYKTAGHLEAWPTHLPGIAEGQNAAGGYRLDPPIMIGAPDACRRVFAGGSDSAIAFQPLKLANAIEEVPF